MAHRLGDVARKAGVSEATVSRVLNGRPGVSESTRAAVLTALDVLGYERPTQLRGERARLVGLVLPELENPIFPALAEVVGGGLAQHGFTPVLCTRTAGGLSEAAYVSMLIQQQVSGVVFAGGHYAEDDSPHEHYRLLKERGVPVMLVNAAIDQLGFPRVSTDDVVAVEQAFGHLWSLGHTRIGAVVGPPDHMPSRRKLAAAGRRGGPGRDRGQGRARAVLHRGRPCRRRPAHRGRGDGDNLRIGPARAGRRARRPAGRTERAG